MTECTEVEKARPPKIDLDAWVVKGSGANRGRYLRVNWHPSWEAIWTRAQGDATRLAEHEARRYARAGGVPTRLVAPRGVVARVRALQDFISERAVGAAERKTLYWIHGAARLEGCQYTEGDGFCEACATTAVAKLHKRFPRAAKEAGICVDGGLGSEEDSPATCTLCCAPLDVSLTSYGVETELEHFAASPPTDGPEDWAAVGVACTNLAHDSPLWILVDEWVKAAKKTPKHAGGIRADLPTTK